MIKSVFSFLIVCSPFIAFSQNKAGFLLGASASSLSDGFLKSGYIGSNSFTYHVGSVYEHEINEKVSFRPKLVLSKQGDREDFEDNLQYETTYINAPLNFKFFNKPYLLFGPQVGYLIETEKDEVDYGDLEKFDYGINLGFGFDVSDFFIEFNLYQGLNTLIEVQTANDRIDTNATNTVLQLSIGYNFDL